MTRLILFDVDGTLCHSGQQLQDTHMKVLKQLYDDGNVLGLVGGGTYQKIKWQFGDAISLFKYVFPENGSIGYDGEVKIYAKDLREQLGDNRLQDIVDILMLYLAKMKLPCKTGHFIDVRSGLIYFVPVGQQCTPDDRRGFKVFDQRVQLRQRIVQDLSSKFPDMDIMLGGELGVSITPLGWHKGQIMDRIPQDLYDEILFFGDKIYPGGNDYPLAIQPRITRYYQINALEETYEELHKILSPFYSPDKMSKY